MNPVIQQEPSCFRDSFVSTCPPSLHRLTQSRDTHSSLEPSGNVQQFGLRRVRCLLLLAWHVLTVRIVSDLVVRRMADSRAVMLVSPPPLAYSCPSSPFSCASWSNVFQPSLYPYFLFAGTQTSDPTLIRRRPNACPFRFTRNSTSAFPNSRSGILK